MTEQEIKIFNELANKLCDELTTEDRCENCPFYQWDGYFSCSHNIVVNKVGQIEMV